MQFAAPDLGKPSIKSIDTVCQAAVGIGKGDSNPGHLVLLGFACWQMEQDCTKDCVIVFIPDQANKFLSLL
jgi:hypothetical protein